jgi:CheY-like chemotaxis protein
MYLARSGICKLLLVEDSDEEVLLFRQVVESSVGGFEIVGRTASGREAVQYLDGVGRYANRATHPWPDVVVLEIRMPRQNGLEVLEWMQGKQGMPEVVIFSRSELKEEKERAFALGAALYQHKAFEAQVIERFLHWIKRLWEVEQLQQKRKQESKY